MTRLNGPPSAFRALSARLGREPLMVQGPGGNTSIKDGGVMWIKASGTNLADAEHRDIFVAVDHAAAKAEARGETGDGGCAAAVLDPAAGLRPSIETTFHAALDRPVVVHTHSVATIAHAISPEGRAAAAEKLAGLPFAVVPYAKPGLPLTREILAVTAADTRVFILRNHGLICCADGVGEAGDLIDEVEDRLRLAPSVRRGASPAGDPPEGFEWSEHGWMARDDRAAALATAGSYYPDHVVFLGPGLPERDHDGAPPAVLRRGAGVLVRRGATPSQRAMLRCLSDVLSRLPDGWNAEPIGPGAEAELLNWDAEKYRQTLAERA